MRKLLPLLLSLSLAGAACNGEIGDVSSNESGDNPFASAIATLLDFQFNGSFSTTSASNLKGQIRSQLLYTVGTINGELGVARVDKVKLTNIKSSYSSSSGRYTVTYTAMLPVAWGAKADLPTSYTLTLPWKIDSAGQTAFEKKYGPTCNDGEADSVTTDNFWYHSRPQASGCSLATSDVASIPVTVSVDTHNTTAKYPEYDAVWADGQLNVVAVFAKYATGDTNNDDAGIDAYNQFVAATAQALPGAATVPATINSPPGVHQPDVTFTQTRGDGTVVHVVALLIDSVPTAGAAFTKRYAELTPGADIISYNGHAGLGANVKALATMGVFFPGKYQIFFFNGCDTFAYMDDTLATRRAALNPDDPTGTKYMDMMMNAMPAYFSSMPGASLSLISALAHPTTPESYDDIFEGIDQAQIVVVDGEEDNVYGPTYDPGTSWNGFTASDVVGKYQSKAYQTDLLDPGTYVFEMTPDWSATGGDGDLRVRVGAAAPSSGSTYKCPSYKANSNERCVVTLTQPNTIFMSATGDSTALAHFRLDAWQQPTQ